MDVKGHMLFLLLEQGLDSVLPVPDALAQLCLLDELLRGGNEELHIPSDQLLIAQGHWHGLCFQFCSFPRLCLLRLCILLRL